MKKYFLSLTFLALVLATFGQDLVVQPQLEYTVAGTQYGGGIHYETRSSWGLGLFYLADVAERDDENEQKNEFLGMFVQAPLVTTERLSFFATLRAGFANKSFVAFAPGLETRLHITPHFGTSFGMALRMGYPSVTGKVFLKLF